MSNRHVSGSATLVLPDAVLGIGQGPWGSASMTAPQLTINGTDNTVVKFDVATTPYEISYNSTTGEFRNISNIPLVVLFSAQLKMNTAAAGDSCWFQLNTSASVKVYGKQTFSVVSGTSCQSSISALIPMGPSETVVVTLFQTGSSTATVWGGGGGDAGSNPGAMLTFVVI